MFALLDNNMFESESSMLDIMRAIEWKKDNYPFDDMSDEELYVVLHELYGPSLNNKKQKEYWKDKVYISYVDGVDPDTVCIRYSNETLVYITKEVWDKYHEALHDMPIEEVIREFALEVKDKEYYASKDVNSNLYT